MILPVQCGFAFLTALLFQQKLPLRSLFRGLFFLPQITSMVVVCVVWATLFQYPTGPFNQIVHAVSGGAWEPADWLGNPCTAMFATVLLPAWQAYGFQMVIYLAGLQGIPKELCDAAKMDGAGPFRRFCHVTIPGLRATHVFVLLIVSRLGLADTLTVQIMPFVASPLYTILFYQFFAQLPKDLSEAAMTDRASIFRTSCSIYMPLGLLAVATVAILMGIESWNQYLWLVLISQSNDSGPIAVAIGSFFEQSDIFWDKAMAASLLIMLSVTALYIAIQRWFVSSFIGSAIKG